MMKLVRVKWVDSSFHEGWCEEKDALNLTVSECLSAGMMIGKTKDAIILALNKSDAGNYSNLIAISRKCILKITELKEG